MILVQVLFVCRESRGKLLILALKQWASCPIFPSILVLKVVYFTIKEREEKCWDDNTFPVSDFNTLSAKNGLNDKSILNMHASYPLLLFWATKRELLKNYLDPSHFHHNFPPNKQEKIIWAGTWDRSFLRFVFQSPDCPSIKNITNCFFPGTWVNSYLLFEFYHQ